MNVALVQYVVYHDELMSKCHRFILFFLLETIGPVKSTLVLLGPVQSCLVLFDSYGEEVASLCQMLSCDLPLM